MKINQFYFNYINGQFGLSFWQRKLYHSDTGMLSSRAWSYNSEIEKFSVNLSAYLNFKLSPIDKKYFLSSSSLFRSSTSLIS